MALGLAFVALLLLVVAVRGTQAQLFGQLASDLPGFAKWLGALLLIGLIGYIPGMETISNGLLALVFVVLVLAPSNRNAFANFAAAFKAPPAPTTAPPAATQPLGQYLPIQLFGSSGSAQGTTGAITGAVAGGGGGVPGGAPT